MKDIKENIKMGKNVEKEYTIGVMVNMKKDSTLMIKSMVKQFIIIKMGKIRKDNIKMEIE